MAGEKELPKVLIEECLSSPGAEVGWLLFPRTRDGPALLCSGEEPGLSQPLFVALAAVSEPFYFLTLRCQLLTLRPLSAPSEAERLVLRFYRIHGFRRHRRRVPQAVQVKVLRPRCRAHGRGPRKSLDLSATPLRKGHPGRCLVQDF